MDNEKIILAFIYKNQNKKMEDALRISDNYFVDKVCRKLYKMIVEYTSNFDEQVFAIQCEKISNKAAATKLELLFYEISQIKVDRDKFELALDALKTSKKKNDWIDAQKQSIHHLLKKNDITQAQEVILDEILKQEYQDLEAQMDEGDARKTSLTRYDAYLERKKDIRVDRQPFYFPLLDYCFKGGVRDSEFGLLEAFISQGKSMMVAELAYRQVINGDNIIIGSGEMDKSEYEDIFICRHIHKFYPAGIPFDDIDGAKLDNIKRKYRVNGKKMTAQELYKYACWDWQNNKNYGRAYIFPFKKNTNTIGLYRKFKVYEKMAFQDTGKGIGMFFIDSIQHLKPVERNYEKRIEADEILSDIKQMCLLTKWRVIGSWWASRKGYEDACKLGYYSLTSLSESSGAERNVNFVIWLLQTPDMETGGDDGNTIKRIKIGISKLRRGAKLKEGKYIYEDFSTCILDHLEEDEQSNTTEENENNDEDNQDE